MSGNYDQVPSTGVGVFNRDTYDVIPTAFITGSAKQQALVTLLGSGGVYGAAGKTIIKAYGFGFLSYGTNSSNWLDGAYQH